MTSSNGNIFRVTRPLCAEFTGHRWIPIKKASDAELRCFLWSAPWIKGWVNNRDAGDLRRHGAHYYATVMFKMHISHITTLRSRQNGRLLVSNILNTFSCQKIVVFIKFQLELFPRVQWTIYMYLHWFREWLGTEQAISHCLYQWRLCSLTQICVIQTQWVSHWTKRPVSFSRYDNTLASILPVAA